MKKYVVLLSFLIGIGCFVAFSIIGSEIAPDGTLIEPFFLIPIAYLFLFIGIILGVTFMIQNVINRIKKSRPIT
ncbi:DUF3955 domain-containing protein [Paenibacillus sp. GSMTC-2017]|uniref:DUF3955 domain-containing protein n=1 Tax=Paenibacillus sp. GSMTC-2017 TaxID=2794350 RepID=UPI0018D5AD2B|nr:DUF3955 domain-containing protein [Paenibacillus sp. GSMTC-2017]MBH5317585.1 DUF3955 domain-containing protein [Paenibacillus sp. GSMTC-2017]